MYACTTINQQYTMPPGPIPCIDVETHSDNRPLAISDGFMPKPPKWLNKVAKGIFVDAATRIVMMSMGGIADTTTIAIYANQYARLQELAKLEKRDLKQDRMLNDLTSSVLSLANQLGLTPGGRARLRIAKNPEATTDDLRKAIEQD